MLIHNFKEIKHNQVVVLTRIEILENMLKNNLNRLDRFESKQPSECSIKVKIMLDNLVLRVEVNVHKDLFPEITILNKVW